MRARDPRAMPRIFLRAMTNKSARANASTTFLMPCEDTNCVGDCRDRIAMGR